MSRRKQARPIKLLEDELLPSGNINTKTPLTTNEDCPTPSPEEEESSITPEEPRLQCPKCEERFTLVAELIAHKSTCPRQSVETSFPLPLQVPLQLPIPIPIPIPISLTKDQQNPLSQTQSHTPSDPEDMITSDYEDEPTEEENPSSKSQEKESRIRQDAANNNSVEDNEEGETLPANFPFPLPASASHVTLEALQNTKVAVAQFAATAMASGGDNEAALQELAVLQSTLFTLQHQQVFQLQLINQLQHQLKLNNPAGSNPAGSEPSSPRGDMTPETMMRSREISPERPITPTEIPIPNNSRAETPPTAEKTSTIPETPVEPPMNPSEPVTPNPNPCPIQPPLCSISSSLAASIITNNDPPPSLDEPNTLEMLQKRAQEVLDNASQGLLANNLADELAFRKKGSMSPYDSKSGRNEPFFKHRCRYCGKVFGSDSALQIHIRSHTGERPFKCNVCGSRFTTKGNLKVHFQRHTSKFPHIKMNPNPIPEHLDKYHPPLLAQMGNQGPISPGGPMSSPIHPHNSVPFSPGHPFPPSSIPIYRPPIIPPAELIQPRLPLLPRPNPEQPNPNRMVANFNLFVKREEDVQDVPENLSKPLPSSQSPSPSPAPSLEPRVKSEVEEKEDRKESQTPTNSIPKQEMDIYNDDDRNENMESPGMYDDCSMESKYEDEELLHRRSPGMENENEMQDEPENLSNKSNSVTTPLSISTQKLPASFNFPNTSSPPSTNSENSLGSYSSAMGIDPSKDPLLYTSLLPRPGSNDNSWESLIEITKTSETSKLQQLVDNIEHKLTDPNQCVVCHRVLSCKSALQMHYRTHTGERPFKCKICGRAFTTKGNLKTHMGVHRAKPPMRVLHQCPVCHKKFTNALVLQQHIRLHTGEPTDLTPEQIQAAEVKEFSPPSGFPPVSPFLGSHISVPGLSPLTATNLSINSLKPENLDLKSRDNIHEDEEDDDEDERMDTGCSESGSIKLPNFSTSLAALENQVRTITTTANLMNQNQNQNHDSHHDFLLNNQRLMTSTPNSNQISQNGMKSPDRSENESPVDSEVRGSPSQYPVQLKRPPSSNRSIEPESESESLGALDLRAGQPAQSPSPGPPGSNSGLGPSPGPPGIPGFPGFPGLLPPSQPGSSPLISSALSSLTSSVLNTTAYNPLGIAVGPTIRGNTTCSLCFKTFACHSALEIHYRSHTKERPFKCTICDRGFSTKKGVGCQCPQGRIQGPIKGNQDYKTHGPEPLGPPPTLHPGYATALLLGNMKQHMLTHKIRDMPHHIFDKPIGIPQNPSLQSSNEDRDRDIPKEVPVPIQVPREREVPIPEPPPPQNVIPIPSVPEPPKTDPPIKRSTSESELPIPKRTPTSGGGGGGGGGGVPQNSKHLCHVCNKNFSSSSALQIHMRTHTGDKPFRCTVCQKAFTTKGNLKVHMGTHMWSNGASRRGRRMSLDLPPIPMTPKDSEFLQRRPDLFYPYLPAPFLNGMQQKLNDMSAIQNPNPTKYTGLLGFGYPTPEPPRSQSPSSDKPQTRPPSHETSEERGPTDRDRDMLPRMWDLHYDRKQNSEERSLDMSTNSVGSNAPLALAPPPRGEGLAA